VVVASSWGAVVVRICALRGLYSGPLLALTPVPKLIIDRLRDSEGRRLAAYCSGMSGDAARRVLMVHKRLSALRPWEWTANTRP